MNKLMTLVNTDLKRSKKFYLMLVSLLFITQILINTLQIINYKKQKDTIDLAIETFYGVFYGNAILYENYILFMMIGVGVLALIVYSIYSWSSEYMQKSKSFYTLLMLPINKYYIYLAKIISTVTMVYGFLISQIIALFIAKNIFNILVGKLPIMKTSLAVDILSSGNDIIHTSIITGIIPATFVDFIMTYGFKLITILSVMFCGILILLSYKDSIGKLLGILIIYLGIVIVVVSKKVGEGIFILISSQIGTIGFYILFYVIAICISNIISYHLINKKLFV